VTKLSRGVTLASAVCAALLAAGIADAKSSQTRMSAAPMPSAQAVAAAVQQRLTDRQQLSRPDLPRPPDALQPGFGDREPFVLRHFDEIDADQSGAITKAEIEAYIAAKKAEFVAKLEETFKAADADSSGGLSADEAKAGMPHVARHFEALDANDDGVVTLEELKNPPNFGQLHKALLDKIKAADSNGDNKIDVNEVAAVFPDVPAADLQAKFDELDRNDDGWLSVGEIISQLRRH